MKIPNIYENKKYKYLLIAPVLLIIFSIFMLPYVPSSIQLKGGILVTAQTSQPANIALVENQLKTDLGITQVEIKSFSGPQGNTLEVQLPPNNELSAAEQEFKVFYPFQESLKMAELNVDIIQQQISTHVGEIDPALQSNLTYWQNERAKIESEARASLGTILGYVSPGYPVEGKSISELLTVAEEGFSNAKEQYRTQIISSINSQVNIVDYSYQEVGPSLSFFFLERAQTAVMYALILSAIVIFVFFRRIIPSIAVIIGALVDILAALGFMALFQIPLSLPSIAALLMLIGYSLDTDVLLTVKVTQRKEGTPADRAYGALKTGLGMTTTTLSAFGVLLVVSIFIQVPTYFQIASVMCIGLLADLVGTWFTNAVLILWHEEKREKR